VRFPRLTTRRFATAAFVLLAGSFGARAALAKESIRVALQKGWEEGVPDPSVEQFGQNNSAVAFFQLIVESKSDFAASLDLMTYAKKAKEHSAKSSKLANRTETALQRRRVAGRDTVEYEVLGEFKDTRLHYRHIALACGRESFCQLVCWTLPSHWDDVQGEFDALVKNLH
jgi:hypothetical protein